MPNSLNYGITVNDMVDIALEEREKQRLKWIEHGKLIKFDINEHIEEEEFILKVRNHDQVWDIAGAGSIGVIAGPPKARKTAVLSAIEAAGLSGGEVLGFTLDLKGGRILSVDTEQKRGSWAKVRRNVYKWAKIPENKNPENYESYCLRSLYPEERLQFIQAHHGTGSVPKLLVIDVITDLMYDFNDNVRSQKLVEDIMKLAGTETMTILTIHLGKGGLVLGHIGSALARKVDFLFEVTLDDDYMASKVACKLTRDAPMFGEFMIRQDKHPPRIYRPDLENGLIMGVSNMNFGGDHIPAQINTSIPAGYVISDDEEIPF